VRRAYGIIVSTLKSDRKENEVSSELDVIQGRYFSDLLAQPEALRTTWNSLRTSSAFEAIARACTRDRFQRVVLTGMGSSYFGLYPLCIELAAFGWTPLMLETSELIHYYSHLLTSSTLIVAVSQSGKSVETVRLLDLNAKKATVIGVTNSADSPLAQQANIAVLTAAGTEFTVSCKTYLAAQMALSTLAAALCDADPSARLNEFQPAASAVESYLSHWKTHVAELAELLRDTRDIFLVGRGASLAAASTGALVIKESDHFHAEGMSSAALRHGPFEMLQPGIFVGVFGGNPATRSLNDGLMQDLAETPAKSVIIAPDSPQPACRLPEVPRAAGSIVEMLPIQMITLALAALARREAGKFDRATKVTMIE
jgi:glutamine---fructose-6-phosphate transaminase (isomerizing)